ncbi:M23 family metallopeptidase [Helicobacter bizzozeronii]|uniref:M23 family metallopeptidase n=1 Tax=Helicobacter bizzozeronii TaxID=56877 RepID=UPI000CF170B0|nr:M23 family metallopeptidase [Helicobacter bizzozeronii]
MHDKLVLTIIDENGSKQLRLSKKIKRHLFLGALLVVAGMVAGGWFLSYLVQKIGHLNLEKHIVESDYQSLYHKNNSLKKEIAQKTQEIAIITHRIRELKKILEVKKSDGADAYSGVDLNKLSIANKTLALALIPNGEPLKSYTSKAPTAKKKSGNYEGYDFSVPLDTPVYATASGIVDVIFLNRHAGYGNVVRLDHAFGFSSIYAHLSQIVVKRHAFVQKGELLGYSGNSGGLKRAQLHYEIRFLGQIVDMPRYLNWDLAHFESIFKGDSQVDWKNLFYSISDMAQIQGYQNADQLTQQSKEGASNVAQ